MRRLLIRPGAIGDFILSLPTLEAARAEYTEVWAPRPVLPLIRFANATRAIIDTGIERVGVVEGTRVAALDTFDSIYSWYGTNHPEFREAVRDLPFTFFPALPPSPGIPIIPVPQLPMSDFVVIHPFASNVGKRVPLDHFRRLATELECPIRWLAGPEESLEEAERFDDLYELACWLSTARLYIGNDSGISHLAAAVGVPTLAIFLTSDPQVWAPRGPHVRVLERPSFESTVLAARGLLR
ncbi:MAG: glycosyltransferase family 9 protein [Bryobacteraceae bacterium]